MAERVWEAAIGGQPGVRTLARSMDFTVFSMFETVLLTGRSLPIAGVRIGDFYGDPAAAMIDAAQSWCLVVGEGFIAYRLGAPWRPYDASRNDQFWEFGRASREVGAVAEKTLWIDTVTSTGPGLFVVVDENAVALAVDTTRRMCTQI